MASQKTFTTFSEQIDLLKNEKHLVISDPQSAEEILKRIGYFPLFGGYKHLFRILLTKKYKDGTTFDEIVALYDFDSELRELFSNTCFRLSVIYVLSCPIIFQENMAKRRRLIWIGTITTTTKIRKLLYA